jgi:uncharacterized protein
MTLTNTARELYDRIAEASIIDAHEHLPSESVYLSFRYSGLNLFAGYIQHDLRSSGLPESFVATMREGGDRPVASWWPSVKPHWHSVRHTSYSRALLIAARDLWGIAAIDDTTIAELAERVRADNTPGLYRRILQDRCRIRCSITCVDQPAFPDDPGLKGIVFFEAWKSPACTEILLRRAGSAAAAIEDASAAAQASLRKSLSDGAIGFKMSVSDYRPPDAAAAARALEEARGVSSEGRIPTAVRDYLFDQCCDVAVEADVPVAVHTGYWGDFRELDPKLLLGFALRRQDVRFDLFHLGAPMYRDAILIGKSLPNVTLNLTWCPIISQVQAARSLDEILDLVPVNKIIAFGGDYRVSVQKVYGHLVMAREVVAAALARRVDAGEMDIEEAWRIAGMWLSDNPARVYRLA